VPGNQWDSSAGKVRNCAFDLVEIARSLRANGGRNSVARPSALTCAAEALILVAMRIARSLLLAVIAVALTAYAYDCGAPMTSEQAMQCCNSMPCSSHGHHGKDCCKTMPTMHAPFVQPSSAHGVPYSPVVVAVLTSFAENQGVDSSARTIAEHSHAPPIGYSPASLPLRI
jgi:hypothetical protein